MKLNYKQKIFLYFFIVFALFTVGVIIFERERERNYKAEIFESDQDVYVGVIHQYIEKNKIGINEMDRVSGILPLLPENIRVTIIDENGAVAFDNDISNSTNLENHKDRPEIKKAALKSSGSNIRKSTSLNREFMYFARYYGNYFVRVAMPYDVTVKNFLKPDNVFLYFIIFLFFAGMVAIAYISSGFGKSIARLKDFIISAQDKDSDLDRISFPNDELGEIGRKIVDVYKQARVNRKKITVEREKLLQHFQFSHQGICFFTPARKVIYFNSHFVQFLNVLLDEPSLDVNSVFEDETFKNLQTFLDSKKKGESNIFEENISKNGKHFNIRAIRFDDESFEIMFSDVTKLEKNRQLKQEMTNNIAHDLRTPVTSIRGYLETLKEQQDLDPEKRTFFIERAFSQIVRLSELIRDISLITRMEEASDLFEIEDIRINPLLQELKTDLSDKLNEHGIRLEIKVNDSVHIQGNRSLLYSIFRNLMDNSIAYGGDSALIHVENYMEDNNFYYFSYYDTGAGVEERHLSRLFDRFYRVAEGRTSNTGGSGLGLAIVKNAVHFHKGEITAKRRKEGGLEFLFTLRKEH